MDVSKTVAFHFFFITIFVFISIVKINASENGEEYSSFFVKSMDPKSINYQPEKLTHFTFYFHDTLSGKSPSSVVMVRPHNNTTTSFGLIDMMDNPLTVGPEIKSKLVGRTQGFYASASQKDVALLMIMNIDFIQSPYNGSTITVMGRNPVFQTVREMPVIGGSGVFRFARGYAQAKTHSFDFKTGDAVVQYNLYVFHN